MKKNNIFNKIAKSTGIIIPKSESRFEYPLYKFYFKLILYVFIAVISFLSLLPLVYYWYMKDKAKNMYIDNKKVIFKGTIISCYQAMIPWLIIFVILSLITRLLETTVFYEWLANNSNFFYKYLKRFIVSLPTVFLMFIVFNRLYKWGLSNLYFGTEYGLTRIDFQIKKILFSATISKIARTTVIGIPLGLYIRIKYLLNRSYISDRKIVFTGTIKEAYKWFIFRMILVVITLFLYYPVYIYKQNKWISINTHIL